MTIWPIKIERVPRRWRDRRETDGTQSRVVPDEPLVTDLIEPAIVLSDAPEARDPDDAPAHIICSPAA